MLTYRIERGSGRSLYEQLYLAVRHDIEGGVVAAGQKLPSKRELARHLGISVITVEAAYDQLEAEGYVLMRERSGVYVNDVGASLRDAREAWEVQEEEGRQSKPLHLPATTDATPDAESGGTYEMREASADFDRGRRQPTNSGGGWVPEASGPKGSDASEPRAPIDLTGRSGGARLFPYSAWARIQRKVLSDCDERTLLRAGQAQGSWELRCALADYLRGFRGMEVSPDQIVVGAGAQVLYPFVVQLLGRERLFALETPGYRRLAQVYASNDVAIAPVPVDRDGISVPALAATGASVVHCMPSHQLPGGMVLPAPRRRELLRWAAEGEGPKRYIVEDDYDCEFRMAGRPIAPLQAIDGNGSVIYANTFTKTLGPALRMAYLVLPPHLAVDFRERLGFYSCTAGATDQLTLARFIASGEFERHVNRLRTGYRKVQDALVAGLRAGKAATRLSLHQVGAGLHFLVEVQGASGLEAAERLRREGVAADPLEAFELRPARASEPQPTCASDAGVLVVNFSGLRLQDVAPVVEAFERAF